MKKSLLQGLILTAALLLPVAAFAHAFPQHSQPPVGSTVKQSPPAIKIWFNSDLEPLFNKLVVKNAAGKVVTQQPAKVDPNNRMLLEVALPPLPPGQYHVYWRVTAKDGHRTEGDYTFTISRH
ncbi:MAG TPA: copper resistance CopC family protein [Gammaproteobacteria bacterium]|nr:copper resistance CopC family protein [Gammaproteobacteria bacterium]